MFLSPELADRREGDYPPFSRLCNVVLWGRDAMAVRRSCDAVAARLRERLDGVRGWEVLGPADCLKARVKDRTRRHVLVKAPVGSEPGELLSACVAEADVRRGVSVAIDVDAYDLM